MHFLFTPKVCSTCWLVYYTNLSYLFGIFVDIKVEFNHFCLTIYKQTKFWIIIWKKSFQIYCCFKVEFACIYIMKICISWSNSINGYEWIFAPIFAKIDSICCLVFNIISYCNTKCFSSKYLVIEMIT